MSLSEEQQVCEMLNQMGVETVVDLEPEPEPEPEPQIASSLGEPQAGFEPRRKVTPAKSPAIAREPQAESVTAEQSERAKVQLSQQSGRDMSISTLVHLLGLPSSTQVRLLETKVDALTAKISSMASKVDRISAELNKSQDSSLMERVDYQLTDIRSLMKKVLPASVARLESSAPKEEPSEAQGPTILKSTPKIKAASASPKPKPETEENLEEDERDSAESALPGDAEFQQSEAARMRGELDLEEE